MTNREVVVVTGAGGGIGSAVTKEFARKGAFVVGCERDHSKVAHLAEKLGDSYLFIERDLSEDDAAKIITRELERLNGSVHAAVFCHGGPDQLRDTGGIPPTKVWRDLFEHNVAATLNALHGCWEMLLESRGVVVLIGSINSVLSIEESAYSFMKGGYTSLAMNIKAASHGAIQAFDLKLGTVITEGCWGERTREHPEIMEKIGKRNIAGKVMLPEDVAHVIYGLTRPELHDLNAQAIYMDRHWSLFAGTQDTDQPDTPWFLR